MMHALALGFSILYKRALTGIQLAP